MVAFRCVAVSRRPEQKNLNNARWNEVEDVNKTISSKTSNFQAVVSLATATCPSLATPQRAAKNRINFCEKYIRRLRHKRLKKKNGFNLDSTSNSFFFFFFSKIDYRLIFTFWKRVQEKRARSILDDIDITSILHWKYIGRAVSINLSHRLRCYLYWTLPHRSVIA